MATLSELCFRQELQTIDCGLEAEEQPLRLVYAFPHVVDWLKNKLRDVEAEMADGLQSPTQQLDDLLHDFASGEDLSYWERSHSMHPDAAGVWELKTADLRLFGWFKSRGIFIVANVDTAMRCKVHQLYAGYRGDCERRRADLDLDPPKHIQGGYSDVL